MASPSSPRASKGAPPPRGGLIGYAMGHRPGDFLGLTQGGGLLSTKLNGGALQGGLLGAASRAGANTIRDVTGYADFLLRNVLPGSSEASALKDAARYYDAASRDVMAGRFGSGAGNYAQAAALGLGGLIPFGALAAKGVRSLPGIGELGKSAFKALRLYAEDGTPVNVLRNPSEEHLRALARRDRYRSVRWMRTPDGEVFAWPAGDATHYYMNQVLGYEGDPDPSNLGQKFLEGGELKDVKLK